MFKKAIASLSLALLFSSISHAAVVTINGGYYSKIEGDFQSTDAGILVNEFEQSYFDYLDDTISQRLAFDPNTTENRHA
jgi:hypothetical protein